VRFAQHAPAPDQQWSNGTMPLTSAVLPSWSDDDDQDDDDDDNDMWLERIEGVQCNLTGLAGLSYAVARRDIAAPSTKTFDPVETIIDFAFPGSAG
jgi:hypothetical protein